jgi:hypothetical protein
MSISVLRLREIVGAAAVPDSNVEFIALDDSKSPPLYVYGKSLAILMIKHPDLKPINFLVFWKSLTGATDSAVRNIDEYFKKTPLFLHQQQHLVAKRSLSPVYKWIEKDLATWVDCFTLDFFKQRRNLNKINTIEFVDSYLITLFKNILARRLCINESQVPDLPGHIFQFLTRLDIILEYEEKVRILKEFLVSNLSNFDQDINQELWSLFSVFIMGTDTLSGALIYLIANNHLDLTVDDLLHRSRPVSIVSRKATTDIKINDLHLSAGQRVYISTGLLSNNKHSESIPFGVGVHVCPGKKISLVVLNAFIKNWKKNSDLHERFNRVKLIRDLVLKAKDI